MNVDLFLTKALILQNNDNQKPQIKTSQSGLNRLEFNVLCNKTNKDDKEKKDFNFVLKIICFNENIANSLLNEIQEDKNNFFTGRCTLSGLLTKQFEEDGKKHNYHKYHTAILNDFNYVITQSQKTSNNPNDNKGWKGTEQQPIQQTNEQIEEQAPLDDDIPF